MQKVGMVHEKTYYNDSISTNPHSAMAAISYFSEQLSGILLGGADRGVDYFGLIQFIKKTAPKAVILSISGGISEAIEESCKQQKVACVPCENIQKAVAYAHENLPAGAILLSPAAPSFDHFINYAARGDAFMAAVHSL